MKKFIKSLKDNNAHLPFIFFGLFSIPFLLVSVNETLAIVSTLVIGVAFILACITSEE